MTIILTLLMFVIALILWCIWRTLDTIGEALWFLYLLAKKRCE